MFMLIYSAEGQEEPGKRGRKRKVIYTFLRDVPDSNFDRIPDITG